MWTRKELKEKAKAHFKANYWPTVIVTFILVTFVVATGSSTTSGQDSEQLKESLSAINTSALLLALVICIAIGYFVINPLAVGCRAFYSENGKENKPRISTILAMFKNPNYLNVCFVIFMRDLFIALWTLLLIIPGVIKTYEYAMVEYIVAEDPSISYKDALAKSKEMMKGNKWKFFVLQLSFILWDLLEVVPLVGFLWVEPYKQQTEAELYLELNK